jgi:hypothetical protein
MAVANNKDLKNSNVATVAPVDVDMLQHTKQQLQYCVDTVYVTNGAHDECTVFRKKPVSIYA